MSSGSVEEDDVAGVDPVMNTLLSVCVVILMLGLGASLDAEEIRKALKTPKPLFIGMVSQFGFMPAMAFALGKLFGLNSVLAISLIVVGSCPGGTTSNLFTYWSDGDVALSVAMTAFSSTLALGMLPLLLYGYSQALDDVSGLKVDYLALILTLLGVVIPVAIGIAVNAKTKYGLWLTRAGSLMGFFVVFFLIIYGSTTQTFLFEQSWDIYVIAILVGILGFGFGYGVSTMLGLTKRQCRTVALETGIQNGPLAIAIVELSLNDSDALIIPFFYSVWIVIESVMLALVFRKIPVEPPPQRSVLATQVHRFTNDKGETIYRSPLSENALTDNFKDSNEPATLYHNFIVGWKTFPERRLLGYREKNSPTGKYCWLTYNVVRDRVMRIGSFLATSGIPPNSTIGIFSINRWEWVVTDLACGSYSYISVPLYDTLGPDAVDYIIGKTNMAAIFCSHDKLALVRKSTQKFPHVKKIIYFEEDGELHSEQDDNNGIEEPATLELEDMTKRDSPHARSPLPGAVPVESGIATPAESVASLGVELHVLSMSSAIERGKKDLLPPRPPQPSDVATICFTSGTTGVPKGAVLTHANIVSTAAAATQVADGEVTKQRFEINEGDVHISYLPLAHMFERILLILYVRRGVAIGFYSGDVKNITADILELRPTIFASVPRLLSRIYDRIITFVDSQTDFWDSSRWPPFPRLRKWMFYAGYETKKVNLKKNLVVDGMWDNMVFSNIADRLGGRIRVVITGSAPMTPEILDFYRIVLSAQVVEGYGQTECAAASHLTLPGDASTGHIGPPLPSVEVKLADIPEMNFSSKDEPCPRGEICLRGPSVFTGYFQEEKLTKEALDDDGWLHTGDVGRINPTGTLTIIDRKKNVFKLSQGEYIAPEKIENILMGSNLVAQIWVHGDSLQSELIAVVVPDATELSTRVGDDVEHTSSVDVGASDKRDSAAIVSALVNNPKARSVILECLDQLGREKGLHSFEIPKIVLIEAMPWTPESGLLTPTMKLRRHDLLKKYRDSINFLYAERNALLEAKRKAK